MPFVQETAPAASTTEVNSEAKPGDAKPADAKANEATPSVATEASVATDTKAENKAEANPEVKPDIKPGVTITKSEAVVTPLEPKAPNDAIWLFTWLPLVVMMGLWLYLRGRNQAAARARAEALQAASIKKSKKPARSQPTAADDTSGAISQIAGERVSKGNSKKNKKDKQQQKKKQQSNSGATTSKATSKSQAVSASASPSEVASSPISSVVNRTETKPIVERTSSIASAPEATTPEQKSAAPAVQSPKAIFEPLRKITAVARTEETESDLEADTSDEQENQPSRRRRPSPPPQVVTTPTKVSSGRFEKLNSPAATAGSSTNRWPAEATRPVTAVRAPQAAAPRTNPSATVEAAKSAPAPITARGLGAFVKLAKPNPAESQAVESVEVENESSST